MKLYELPDSKAGALGDYLQNILGLEADEHIVFYRNGQLRRRNPFAYENGKISRIPLSAYATKTNRKKLINAYSAAAPCGGRTIYSWGNGNCGKQYERQNPGVQFGTNSPQNNEEFTRCASIKSKERL